jgi:predicted Zn-dependent protease
VALPGDTVTYLADRLPGDEHLQFRAALTARDHGRNSEAEDRLTAAISANPCSARNYAVRALVRADRGDFGGAGSDLREAVSLDPKDAYARVVKARYLLSTAGPVDAEEEVRGIVEDFPAIPDAWYMLALCREAIGDTSGAESNLKRAIGLAPSRAVLYRELAQIQAQADDLAAAEQSAREALHRDPTDTLTMVLLAETLLDRMASEKAPEEAERLLQTASEAALDGPAQRRISRDLGRLAVYRGDWKDAIGRLKPICSESSSDAASWYYLARAYREMRDRRYRHAIAKFGSLKSNGCEEKALPKSPDARPAPVLRIGPIDRG